MSRTRIKFCGLTRPGDVRLAGELGVDAIGLVFAAASPRRLLPVQARVLREALAPLVDAVALFMDNPADEVRAVVAAVQPTLLQFHGGEDDAFCRGFGLPYLKAVPMGHAPMGHAPITAAAAAQPVDAAALLRQFPAAAGFLFDGHAAGGQGGQGHGFDWSVLPAGLERPFLLAGGLHPGNVFAAIRSVAPWGVDVSSGIESAPGLKDGDKMRRFVEEVRRADAPTD